jgi:hypothetical protein
MPNWEECRVLSIDLPTTVVSALLHWWCSVQCAHVLGSGFFFFFFSGNAGPHPATVSGCLVTEFGDRRAALMRTLPAGSLAIFPAASKIYMARDIPYPFHQDSDFRYFSGFAEPDAVLLVRSDRTSAEQVHTTLIVPSRNPSVRRFLTLPHNVRPTPGVLFDRGQRLAAALV